LATTIAEGVQTAHMYSELLERSLSTASTFEYGDMTFIVVR